MFIKKLFKPINLVYFFSYYRKRTSTVNIKMFSTKNCMLFGKKSQKKEKWSFLKIADTLISL